MLVSGVEKKDQESRILREDSLGCTKAEVGAYQWVLGWLQPPALFALSSFHPDGAIIALVGLAAVGPVRMEMWVCGCHRVTECGNWEVGCVAFPTCPIPFSRARCRNDWGLGL